MNATETTRLGSKIHRWFFRHERELLLALRTTVAGVIAFVLGEVFGLPSTYWAVLAAVVASQLSVTSSIKESLEQFMAALIGAAWAIVVSSLLSNRVSEVIPLAIVLAPLALLAAVKPRYKAAPATALVVLLSSAGSTGGSIEIGLKRVFDITVGSAVGFAVSFFALPSHTHRQLSLTIADALDLIADIVAQIGRGAAPNVMDHRMRKAFKHIDAMADEAKHEREGYQGYHGDETDPASLIATIRALFDDAEVVLRASMQPLPTSVISQLSEPRAKAFDAVASFLHASASALVKGAAPPSSDTYETALSKYADAIEHLRSEGSKQGLSVDEAGHLFGRGLALTQVRSDLEAFTTELHTYLP